MKLGTRVCLKPSSDRGEFELNRARSKNNIAENSFALGHETHNRSQGQLLVNFLGTLAATVLTQSSSILLRMFVLIISGQFRSWIWSGQTVGH